jgi:hypothetical protein
LIPFTVLQGNAAILLDKEILKKMKKIAQRNCPWPSILQRTNIGLIDLRIKSEGCARNVTLPKSLSILATRFEEDVTSGISRTLRSIHFFFARRFSLLAHRRSSISPKKKACCLSFLRFLTVTNINNSRYSKYSKFHLGMCLQC